MTMDDIRKRKAESEGRIVQELRNFQDETGLFVSDLRAMIIDYSRVGDPARASDIVRCTIEVRL